MDVPVKMDHQYWLACVISLLVVVGLMALWVVREHVIIDRTLISVP